MSQCSFSMHNYINTRGTTFLRPGIHYQLMHQLVWIPRPNIKNCYEFDSIHPIYQNAWVLALTLPCLGDSDRPPWGFRQTTLGIQTDHPGDSDRPPGDSDRPPWGFTQTTLGIHTDHPGDSHKPPWGFTQTTLGIHTEWCITRSKENS